MNMAINSKSVMATTIIFVSFALLFSAQRSYGLPTPDIKAKTISFEYDHYEADGHMLKLSLNDIKYFGYFPGITEAFVGTVSVCDSKSSSCDYVTVNMNLPVIDSLIEYNPLYDGEDARFAFLLLQRDGQYDFFEISYNDGNLKIAN